MTCGDGSKTCWEQLGSRSARIGPSGRGTAERVYRVLESDPDVAISHGQLPDYGSSFPNHPELVAKDRSVQQADTKEFCFVTVYYEAERMDPIEASPELRTVVSLSYQTETQHIEVALGVYDTVPATATWPGNVIGARRDGSDLVVDGVDIAVPLLTVNYSTWRDSLPSANITSGKLIQGLWYRIVDNTGGADWTNRGAPDNNVDTLFQCTIGGYPTSWGTGMLRRNALSGMSAAYRRTMLEAIATVNFDDYKEWDAMEMLFMGADFEQMTETREITSGILEEGITYIITDNGGGFDATALGAPNNNVGTIFTAIISDEPTWGTGAVERPEAWKTNYSFQVRANRTTGSTDGPLVVDLYGIGLSSVEKPGQYYIWFEFIKAIDPATRNWITAPVAAHVDQVYEEAVFNQVFII